MLAASAGSQITITVDDLIATKLDDWVFLGCLLMAVAGAIIIVSLLEEEVILVSIADMYLLFVATSSCCCNKV